MKIAIYDFCDTLADFQTADEFVFYSLNKLGKKQWYKELQVKKCLKNTILKNRLWNKSIILFQLKGVDKSILELLAEEYYKERVACHLQIPVIRQMQEFRDHGYRIFLVSAGYSIYLKHFTKEYGIDVLIANDFQYHNNVFTGKMTRRDCYGVEKCRRLEASLKGLEYDHSVSVSDSFSDLPILKWADKGIVISKKQHRSWVSENGLDEVVLADFPKDINI